MNCVDWEERIALYAGGDLAPAEAPAVEGHVAECAGCQLLLSGLRESMGLLREAHADPVEEAHLAAVRARVLSELERGANRRWRLGWVYAMAVAAMVLLMAVWPRSSKRVAVTVPPAPVVAVAQVPRAEPLLPDPQRYGVVEFDEKFKAVSVAEKPAEPLVVKLLTDDPNVIIYWITDSKGE